MSTEFRLEQVERRLDRMGKRMRELELELEPGEREEAPAPPPWAPPTPRPPRQPPAQRPAQPPPARSTIDFEELFGGRVLAWVGGLAILLGAVLFLGMAISRDWIDEVARTLIAMFGSLALLGVGVWLQEGSGRGEAAQAAAASGIAGLFATLVVATQVYGLITPSLGLLLAALTAALAMAVAVRWSSQIVAAIGALGALGAPVLVGTDLESSIGFAFVALAAITGIVIWQRWGWLVLGAFAVSAPQLIVWAATNYDRDGGIGLVLPGLVGFWLLYVLGAFGYELRSGGNRQLPVASLVQLFASTALVVAAGYGVLEAAEARDAAVIWLFGFSAVLVVLGGAAMRLVLHREIGSLLIAIGIGISALGFAAALSGPALVVAWAVESVVLAYLATRVEDRQDLALSSVERMLFIAGLFLGLAVTHVLVIEAPPKALFEGVENLGSAIAALAACAAATIAGGLLARRVHPAAPQVAGFAAAGILVYLGSILIVDTFGVDALGAAREAGQVWLSVFWAVTGLGALVWGLMRDSAPVRLGGLALLGIAIAKVWTYDLSELDELARVLSFLGLGLLLLVGSFAYQRIKPGR